MWDSTSRVLYSVRPAPTTNDRATQMQSHQSVLKGIGIINQKFILKTDFSYKLKPLSSDSGFSVNLIICLCTPAVLLPFAIVLKGGIYSGSQPPLVLKSFECLYFFFLNSYLAVLEKLYIFTLESSSGGIGIFVKLYLQNACKQVGILDDTSAFGRFD